MRWSDADVLDLLEAFGEPVTVLGKQIHARVSMNYERAELGRFVVQSEAPRFRVSETEAEALGLNNGDVIRHKDTDYTVSETRDDNRGFVVVETYVA